VSLPEVVPQFRTGLDLDLDQSSDQLTVAARLNDPQEAADFANAVATELPDLIKRIDEKKKRRGSSSWVVIHNPFWMRRLQRKRS
jgi:hypothetical protein